MARRGKIARLPDAIREEINSRLHDGQEGKSILIWLNSLPAVQSVLEKSFDGRPINDVNLTYWKQGGYHDWVLRKDSLDFLINLHEEDPPSRNKKSLSETLLEWVTIQYAASAKTLLSDGLDPERKRANLRGLCADVIRLYRTQLSAERLDQGLFWVARHEAKVAETNKDKPSTSKPLTKTLQPHATPPETSPPPPNQTSSPSLGDVSSFKAI